MPKTSFTRRTSAEVAQTVAHNIDSLLAEQGRDRAWLANEVGLTPARLDDILDTAIPFALVLDIADVLNTSWDVLA